MKRILGKILVAVSILLGQFDAQAQQFPPDVDSLIKLSTVAPDSSRAAINNKIAWKIRNFKPETAIQFSMRAIEYATKYENYEELIKGYSFTGVCHRNLGNYTDALDYYHMGLKIAQEHGVKDQEAYAYVNLGNLFLYQENYVQADENLVNALAIAREISDSSIISYSYLNLGRTYLGRKMYSQAEDYLRKALDVRTLNKAPEIQIVVVKKYIGDVYTERQQYDIAKGVYYTCLASDVITTDCDLMADMANKLSHIYYNETRYDSAIFFANQSLDFAKLVGTKYRIKNAYNALAQVFYAQQNYKEAALNYCNEITYNDSIFNEQLKQKLFDIQFSAEQYKKQSQLDIMTAEKKIQQYFIVILAVFLALGLGFAVVLVRNNRKINKLNGQLRQQKDEIQEKNEELSKRSHELATKRDELIAQNEYIEKQRLTLVKQQKQITDSISYAQRIQTAMLPELEKFGSYFSDKFVFYIPRDVVSGDFYWHFEDTQYEMLAVADCTGHGVPGAFMSMLGTSALHEIATSNERNAAVVLERLRAMVKNMLHQKNIEGTPKDGMDIALLVVDKMNNSLEYAGANISIVYIRDNQVSQMKATRNPIGIYLKEKPFSSQKLDLKKGDCFYLSSDGYCSQFGGEHNTRMRLANYRDMLLKIHELPMSEQGEHLKNVFYEWKGQTIQIDDILVAGFRV